MASLTSFERWQVLVSANAHTLKDVRPEESRQLAEVAAEMADFIRDHAARYVYTAETVAHLTGCSVQNLYDWRKAGRLVRDEHFVQTSKRRTLYNLKAVKVVRERLEK